MNKNLKIAIFSFLVLGLTTATAVSAYQGPTSEASTNLNKANNLINYAERVERRKNFHANMSTEDLNKITQMHELMKNGEFEEALKLKDALGIGQGMKQSMGQKHGFRDTESRPNFIDANNNDLCDHMEDIKLK
jgi:hypothetical protein